MTLRWRTSKREEIEIRRAYWIEMFLTYNLIKGGAAMHTSRMNLGNGRWQHSGWRASFSDIACSTPRSSNS